MCPSHEKTALAYFAGDVDGGTRLECQACGYTFIMWYPDILDEATALVHCPHCDAELLYPPGASW